VTTKEDIAILKQTEADGWGSTEGDRSVWAARLLGIDPVTKPVGLVFFGQEEAIGQIRPFLSRKADFPNTLILGEPGIGKTRLARWIADQRAEAFEEVLCPAKPEDIPDFGIVLLDEVHRQKHPEWLFPTMENATVTILGATTRPEQLEPAFASRFFLTLYLTRYSDSAMMELAQYLLPDANEESVAMYASASAGNPRQLERIAAVAEQVGVNDMETVLSTCRITGDGLTEVHLRLLRTLARGNRPMGLGTVASMLYLDEDTVKQHERLLIEAGLIELRSNGRVVTRAGKRYLEVLEQTPKTK
jgi:Holliday junction resolvasome RuvABC ATP-dependent DNA helicase subunit